MSTFAQDAEHPVKWTFNIKKLEDKKYSIEADAKMADNFHIWALDAGGDGSLIETSFELENENMIIWRSEWKESSEPTVLELDYIEGAINWHEKEIKFSRTFESENPVKLIGSVTFQVCNAQSCFPPETHEFRLQVR